jgi:hypothetical protein
MSDEIKREFIPSCFTCMAFQSMENERDPESGQCRRNPPTAIATQTQVAIGSQGRTQTQVASAFPPVRTDMLCMQWMPTPEMAAKRAADAEEERKQNLLGVSGKPWKN